MVLLGVQLNLMMLGILLSKLEANSGLCGVYVWFIRDWFIRSHAWTRLLKNIYTKTWSLYNYGP